MHASHFHSKLLWMRTHVPWGTTCGDLHSNFQIVQGGGPFPALRIELRIRHVHDYIPSFVHVYNNMHMIIIISCLRINDS